MKLGIDKKINLGYLSAFILLIISFVLLFVNTEKVLDHTKRLNLSAEDMLNLETLNASIISLERYHNNYLLSDNKQILHKYQYEKIKIDSSLTLVCHVVIDTLKDAENKKLRELVNNLKHNYDLSLGDFISSDKVSKAAINTKLNNEFSLLDSIRNQIDFMQTRPRAILNKTNLSSDGDFKTLNIITFTSLFIAILMAVYSFIVYSKENYLRIKSDNQATVYKTQLEQRVEELNIINNELNEVKSVEKFAATGRMARMIAHEVRNPLTNIGLANDQLKDAVEANEENVMLMNMIKRNGERINQLVGDLLNATKFVELKLSNYNINDLLDDVLVMAKDRIDLNNTHIIKKYSDKICTVLVDPDKMKIALLNVLINSIEAVKPENGKIEILTVSAEKMCVIKIKDNGGGINTEVMAKVFEPYFTSKDRGNGLGLTITQNIILNHNGNIAVDSEVGRGTDFIIKLKLA